MKDSYSFPVCFFVILRPYYFINSKNTSDKLVKIHHVQRHRTFAFSIEFGLWWVPRTVSGVQHGLCDIWWEDWCFQDLIILQKPIHLKIGNCQWTHPTPSPSIVSKDACICQNFFGYENEECLPKSGIFCPQETCFSQWNMLYPLTIVLFFGHQNYCMLLHCSWCVAFSWLW